jgi:hypothetical protein
MVEEGNAYSDLVEKSEGKRALERPRPRERMTIKYILKK